MASASKSTTLYNPRGNAYTLTASFTENSTNVSNNTSNITCTATLTSTNAYWSSSASSTLVIYWHDNKQNYDRQVASISLKTITQGGSKSASATITVTHKDDGTLSGYAKAVFTKGDTNQWTPKSGSVSTNNTSLTTIARASQPTVTPSTFNIGDTITINTNRKSTAFIHTITLYFGNYSYQIGTGVTDTITFDTSTIADEMYQQIPNASVGVGNVTAVTYNGSTQIGTKNVLFYAKVTNSNPTFNVAYLDTNSTTTAITNNNQQIIRNNSTLQVNITNAEAKNYASLNTATCLINGVTYNASFNGSSATFNIGTINIASDTTAVVTVTDSRGISTSQNLNITILDWELPTAIISLQRENNFYSETNINVNAEYSSLDSKNTISIKVRYKKVDDSTYGSYTTLQDEVTTQLTLDNNYAWNVQVLLEDKIGSTTYNLVLDRGIPIAFFDRLKRSVGINCFPADNESLEVSDENILTRILGYGQPANVVTGDWDTACGTASGIYMGNGLTHSPSGTTVDGWWWVIHIVHNNNYQRQIAYSFLNNSEIYTRIQNNGTWNTWTTIAGGGGGGTSDYTALVNKPQINGVELNGNKSVSDLGISIPSKTSDLTNDSNFVNNTTTGDLSNLSTINKTNLVSAINENTTDIADHDSLISTMDNTVTGHSNDIATLQDNVGDLSYLTTTAQTDLVSAVNEVNGNIPTNISDLTNDSGYISGITSNDVTTALGYTPLENKVYDLDDILAITYVNYLYNELEETIGNQTPFAVGTGGADGYITYEVIYMNNAKHYLRFDYKDENDNLITTEITGSLMKTVTQTTTSLQEKITASNKLDYSLLSNTPTIPTVPTNVSAFTNDAGYLTNETDPVFTASASAGITSTDISNWDAKQEALVSGTNIKTINNQSLLGSGNITIGGGGTATDVQINGTSIVSNDVANILVEGTYSSTNKIASEETIIATTGELNQLQTTTQTDLVDAVNEVNTKAGVNETAIGDLSNLTTTDQSSLVNAINEVNNKTYCNVYASNGITLSSAGTEYNITLNTFYANNGFALSGGQLVCPKDGILAISAGAMFGTKKGYAGVKIYKNGTFIIDNYLPAGTQTYGVIPIEMLMLPVSAGDTLQLRVQSGTANDVASGSTRTRISAFYI